MPRKLTRVAFVAIALPFTANACTGTGSAPATTDCVVFADANGSTTADVTPQCRLDWQRLIERDDTTGATRFADECTDAGGILRDPFGLLWTCEGIDS
ncbi:hypothetical protein BH24ACT5_BH24ACT5_00230 [soil metagenome]